MTKFLGKQFSGEATSSGAKALASKIKFHWKLIGSWTDVAPQFGKAESSAKLERLPLITAKLGQFIQH
jgi:hypothetical protein